MGFQLIGWMDGLNSEDGWISEFNVTFTQASAQQTWEPAQQMIRNSFMTLDETDTEFTLVARHVVICEQNP